MSDKTKLCIELFEYQRATTYAESAHTMVLKDGRLLIATILYYTILYIRNEACKAFLLSLGSRKEGRFFWSFLAGLLIIQKSSPGL